MGNVLRCTSRLVCPFPAFCWNPMRLTPLRILPCPAYPAAGGVLCVALSPCTRFAILGCANGSARMYDVISGGRGAACLGGCGCEGGCGGGLLLPPVCFSPLRLLPCNNLQRTACNVLPPSLSACCSCSPCRPVHGSDGGARWLGQPGALPAGRKEGGDCGPRRLRAVSVCARSIVQAARELY